MTQLSIMIALLAALTFGNATQRNVNPVQPTIAVIPSAAAGGGEGGWPGF